MTYPYGPTNEDRAEWARIGLEAFGRETRQVPKGGELSFGDLADLDVFQEFAGDFLCDLAHLAHIHGHDIEGIFSGALLNFRDELEDEKA